jgi:WD40 repeat protein
VLREFDKKRGHSEVTSIALSPDGSLLAAGHLDESGRVALEVWSVERQQKRELHGHTGPIRSLVFLNDKKIASASDDGTIRIWDATSP